MRPIAFIFSTSCHKIMAKGKNMTYKNIKMTIVALNYNAMQFVCLVFG